MAMAANGTPTSDLREFPADAAPDGDADADADGDDDVEPDGGLPAGGAPPVVGLKVFVAPPGAFPGSVEVGAFPPAGGAGALLTQKAKGFIYSTL
ncbi:hypothetical protein RclHR1_06920008 [Rhizophagus clarus]|uniref:Uncharacterized protein n=1 Tax=Rhizophagus clarus TaxID=94130 RepID=A0A2Z6SK52_9GLOM|nr:hypothetical protein RclHR1_06920008 [Rhizophagus clarus]GES82078.1 hypothetical protein RCL_jg10592.t1 [Rhizophagus clarus]